MLGRNFERRRRVPRPAKCGKSNLSACGPLKAASIARAPRSKSILRFLFNCSLVLLVSVAGGCSTRAPNTSETKDPLVVFAAASLTETVGQLQEAYPRSTSTRQWAVSFGPSSGLARQILAGAPARLFLSADQKWATEVAKAHPRSKTSTFLGNRMVLVVPSTSEFRELTLEQLSDDRIRKIAIANPEGVPAGVTAKQILERSGLWDQLQAKLVPGDDVRQTRAYVERGEADAGIVYATDAPPSEQKVRVAGRIDTALHDPIRYGFVLIDQGDADAARLFDWLHSPESRQIFETSGFFIELSTKEGITPSS